MGVAEINLIKLSLYIKPNEFGSDFFNKVLVDFLDIDPVLENVNLSPGKIVLCLSPENVYPMVWVLLMLLIFRLISLKVAIVYP